jgi:hypothetical protein
MSRQFLSDEVEPLNQTSEATLAALTLQIDEFVRGGTLDSRCAAKLIKRLKKESEFVAENGNSTKSGRNELKKAFRVVDITLREHDANLLVAANAALRVADRATSKNGTTS